MNLYIEAMQSESFSGVYNATAPNPVRMSELCSSLGSVLGRPSWLPVPDFALQVGVPIHICQVMRVLDWSCSLLDDVHDADEGNASRHGKGAVPFASTAAC